MDDRRELLWGLYEDVVAQGRHHESQRLGMTNAMLVVAAAVLGLIGLDERISDADIPAGLFLVVLGIVGAVFALKHYERFRYHMAFAKEYRNALKITGLSKLRAHAEDEHVSDWSKRWQRAVYNASLHWLWVSLHLFVSVLGAVVVGFGIGDLG
jgi:uncharacterized membrane protein YeaQ/YmgE (transglycosylase-associated protein family)